MNKKLKLGLVLFALGLTGVLSMLTVSIPIDTLPKEVTEKISPEILRWLILVQPSILLLLAVVVGTLLFDKVRLTVPTISRALKIAGAGVSFSDQLKSGVSLGIVTGVLTTIVGLIFKNAIPSELNEISSKIQLTPIARLLYGGLTEELLMRFGLMTFIVWLLSKLGKHLTPVLFWLSIIFSALLFAVGHLPIVFTTVQHPTLALISYIILGNSIAGLIFGWLYWKKGLEAAFIGHMFSHVVMLALERIVT